MKNRKTVIFGGIVSLFLLLGGCCSLFNQKPIPVFTFSPENPFAGENVIFDASGSYDPDGKELHYKWNFGDGTSGEGKILSHNFADNGTYYVTLTVYDKFGASASLTKSINVRNPAPQIVKINIKDLNGCRTEAGDILEFSVQALDPASLETARITKITWNFGDGTIGEGKVVRHCYSLGCKEYIVVVTVEDDDGAKTSASIKVYVFPKDGKPTPIIRISPAEIHVNTKVTFDGRDSHDNDLICVPCPSTLKDCAELSPLCDGCYLRCSPRERIVSWRWWIKEDCKEWCLLGYGPTISFTPKNAGTFWVKLEIKDDEECDNSCCYDAETIVKFEVFP